MIDFSETTGGENADGMHGGVLPLLLAHPADVSVKVVAVAEGRSPLPWLVRHHLGDQQSLLCQQLLQPASLHSVQFQIPPPIHTGQFNQRHPVRFVVTVK